MKAGKARKIFSKAVQLSLPSSTELEAFSTLQKIFSNPLFLFHQDLNCKLFINLNAAKSEIEFEAIVYHVKDELEYLKDSKKMIPSSRTRVQPILFLSRQLNQHEKYLQFQELHSDSAKINKLFQICYQELLSQLQMSVLLVCRYCSHTVYNVLYKIIQFVFNILFIFFTFNVLICMHSFKDMNLEQQQLHKALF